MKVTIEKVRQLKAGLTYVSFTISDHEKKANRTIHNHKREKLDLFLYEKLRTSSLDERGIVSKKSTYYSNVSYMRQKQRVMNKCNKDIDNSLFGNVVFIPNMGI